MATRIRTLNFLPEIFKTTTNAQFLKATLDQIVAQPNTKRIEGYIGSKFGYGINAKNYYVTEPTKTRTDYQLDPGVVFLNNNEETANDFISYPGIIDGLKVEGGLTTDNNRLFTSEFYSWDSFTDLDKIINFNQYYWLPEGPERVTVSTETIYNSADYIVTDVVNGYSIAPEGLTSSTNPTITLLRGGTYTFAVNQNSQFWIQGAPGVTGYSPTQPNLQTRDVLGVTNNGASNGVVTFIVPSKNAQNEYNFPGNNTVGVVSTLPFSQVNGAKLSDLVSIDGITALEGLTVLFYNTGIPYETASHSEFYDSTLYDQSGPYSGTYTVDSNSGPISYPAGGTSAVGYQFGGTLNPYPGTDIDNTNYEGGYYTDVNANFYTITYVGDPSDPIIKLIPAAGIPTNEKITATYGSQWIGRQFYRNIVGTINIIPFLSAPLDTLYYQDGTSPNKVGIIKIVDSNINNTLNIETEILGKKQYTASNGVKFTNGLKVVFSGDIYPASYKNIPYYVEGVGTAIELVPVADLIVPEPFTQGKYIPYDTTPYDIGNYDATLYIPVIPDYITIARNAINKNAWSRSNRWFHIDVINATATYNNNPSLVTEYATAANKAKRPIIEFYPNIGMFNTGVIGKAPVDFVDQRTTDAFTQVVGQTDYYPDVTSYSTYTAIIAPAASATTTTIIVNRNQVTGPIGIGQYIADSANMLPNNSYISDIVYTETTMTITVEWNSSNTFAGATDVSFITTDTTVDNYALFDGARIVFAADQNLEVRNKIYVSRFATVTGSSTPIITLTEAPDGNVLALDQTVAFRGYNNQGKDFHFDGSKWILSQQKTTVNEAPKFDIFDASGISFGDKDYYVGTSFTGTTLFQYGIGSGPDDIILGFPVRYSSVDNVGDLSFDVTLNSDTFNYVRGTAPQTQKVNTGYVYNYTARSDKIRQLGWQTAISPSVQYQIFEFNYVTTDSPTFTCDIPLVAEDSTNWPRYQVYINNDFQPDTDYTITETNNTTIITLNNAPVIDTVVQILLLSDQTSSNAYYQIPINLNNNPLNQDLTVVNVGDIRGQYQSMFYNNPDTIGPVIGSNNFRDLGNLVPYGNRIIQNSASLVAPGAFLRKQNHNLFNSLLYNSRQYITFKTLLVDTVNNTDYNNHLSASDMLDTAMDQITALYTNDRPFFWSDMLPSKAAYISNTYSFANSLDVSIYPLSRTYDFTKANYYGVLVYLTRTTLGVTKTTQLIRNIDYTVSTDAPSLTVTIGLLPGDQITIKEYNQTYGSYVPNTPTKLGLYPATVPQVILDSAYAQPTYFILGHDGSYNKLYGDYYPETQTLVDFRDQVLLEYEKRVYNNLKLSNTIPIQAYEVLPGFFRNTDYTYDEILEIYSESFLNWVGQNRVDYKTQFYNKTNEYTYNYRDSGNKINKAPIEQGYWRGMYLYFYDTSTPDVTPWEMLGYRSQPSWWTERYGPYPYTSDNLVLWGDLAAGYDWNNGNPVIIKAAVRPELLQILPVDSAGNLVSPMVSIVGNYNDYIFGRNWKVGDVGPTELSYRRSSSYPFDLMRILALTKPAEFFNLAIDVDNYKYNVEFNQYLVNDRSHLVLSDVQIYGDGVAKTSYINWIVDYEKQIGVDATTNITTLLNNLDVRLVYRVAGFTDKNMLKFYVEKSTANSNNSSLLIPDESYGVLLYDNQPFDKILYSGVVVQITKKGYSVYGNGQTQAFFKILEPKLNGNVTTISVEDLKVNVANDYTDNVATVPYGTEFYSVEQLSQFLISYGRYLESQGCVFDQIEQGIPITWEQMVAEFLYWVQIGWEVGSITNINPAASLLAIDKESTIVQPLTFRQQNFVLNQNLYPIPSANLSVLRDGTAFTVQPLSQGDTISYGQFNVGNIEHGIVFDNITLFGDIIYNLITGLRQIRITVRGVKTADWDGTVDAQGFILNQDNIQEWSKEFKYTTGSIVKYKNKYWIAITIVQAKELFDEREWKETDYNEIQKGLLPNSSTRSYESTIYYDVNKANLENDADLLSFSLIGYRPRDYMAVADLTDITQVNVYKNMIKEKGTLAAASAFKGANLAQGGIDYEIFENWAIKSGEFGGLLNNNFVDIKLNESVLTGNPCIIGLTNYTDNQGVQQEVPLYSLYNYARNVTDPNILATLPTTTPNMVYPDAGFVNFNDVKMSSYFYSGMANAVNASGVIVPLNELYVRDYVWLADYLGTWQVYTPVSIGQVVYAKNNLNSTVTITFSEPHNLTQYQPFAIVSFDSRIDGYKIVASVIDSYRVIINLNLDPSVLSVTGNGTGFSFQSQRVATPSEIINLPLLDSEFIKNKVWVDTNNDGSWAVYRKSINYQYYSTTTKSTSTSFGSAVAFTQNLGALISDSGKGEAYRYRFNALTKEYELAQTIAHDVSFGTTISYVDNVFVVSEPTSGTPKVYIFLLEQTLLLDRLTEIQVIEAPSGVTNWGTGLALSGDKNWLYISDTINNQVYVYRKSSLTNLYENVTSFTAAGLTAGDNFGKSIATDYYGDTIVVGAPDQDYSPSIANYGYTYIFQRTSQNIEAQYTSQPLVPQNLTLAWSPTTVTSTATQTSDSGSINPTYITVSSTTSFAVDDPVIFTGTILSPGSLAANTVYYIEDVVDATTFTVSSTRGGAPIELVYTTGSMTVNVQKEVLFVNVNGTLLDDNQYAVVGSTLVVIAGLTAGDIINVSGSNIVEVQTLTTENTPKIGVKFGTSVDTTNFASQVIVGAPFELTNITTEGAVYSYTNGGCKYGIIIGTSDCTVTTTRKILLNGYLVNIPVGNAQVAANAINSANVTNVSATALDGKLIIQLININLATPNNKLNLVTLNSSTLTELGIDAYTQTQTILCPHIENTTQFGTIVKFNSADSFVASAPTGSRYEATTFDFSDDETDNDTIFDNNSTQWVDSFDNAGAVYMFDYLSNYNESLLNPGSFVYAQSINDLESDYGSYPMYGQAIDFNDGVVIVGCPAFNANGVHGQVISYNNISGQTDWSVYRQSSDIVDIDKLQTIQLYSASTNNTLAYLDYMDPLQGKLLGVVRENINVVSNADPATYNSPASTQAGLVWGADKVGHLWFNTKNTKFVNYHQNDNVYNSKYWGKVFPGSDVAVYSWVASNVPPTSYTGPGTPYNAELYTVDQVVNNAGTLTPVYFFWARNTNIIFNKEGNTLADSILESYITNPQASGINYFAPLLPNVFALYNSGEYINYTDTVLHIAYGIGTNEDVPHSLYSLIRANYPDDFLPGLPNTNSIKVPESLYARMIDSLSGTNIAGSVVPDPYLPKPVQNGILARPRQSFFVNRLTALHNYLQYANEVVLQYPLMETWNSNFIYELGTVNPSTDPATNKDPTSPYYSPTYDGPVLLFYDTKAYWETVNWWAPGYNDNTKAALQVSIYADLTTLAVPIGTIVKVLSNGNGYAETYIFDENSNWTRIGLENGTIQFNDALWDYETARLGFGDNFFDTTPYDTYPSEETRYIVRALNEELPGDLNIYRNKALILLFDFIQSETIESQNYLPWLNKTSFIDVSHTIRELKPIEVYQSDNQDFLTGYLNEIKPYHVVIKEFLYKYTGTDIYEGDITDFDLPAQYDSTIEQFVTPQLVYQNPNGVNEFLPTDPIWQTNAYNQWFNNYGLSITGVDNYLITTLSSYISLNSNAMAVDNASGFPINGVIQIGTEQIGYSHVDRALNVLSGLTRGVNGTSIVTHLPGENIYIDLPAVLLLNGGRNYTEPPKVTAYIDTSIYPPPTVPAVLTAVMNLDSVLSITVENPGQGYAVLPKIVIDYAITVTFSSTNVNTLENTIELYNPRFVTGDLVIYNIGVDTTPIGGLQVGQHYYVGVLETSPSIIVALYSNYADSLIDENRLTLFSTGSGSNNNLSIGAIASCVSTASPIRENQISMRFDRTSYTSQVTDWHSGRYYGSYYAGDYNNSMKIASSSISLQSTVPPISMILASAEAGAFEITDVTNRNVINWSSQYRSTISTGISGPNEILIYPSNWEEIKNEIYATYDSITAAIKWNEQLALFESTIGFYPGMPVRFIGAGTTELINGITYYVKTITGNLTFTVSDTAVDGIPGSELTLSSVTIGVPGLPCQPSTETNTAVVSINYQGIEQVTATTAGSNTLTVPLNPSGTGGTRGFFTGLPLFFTGTMFGNVVENEVYYVTSVIDLQTFTISTTELPLQFNVGETSSTGNSISCNTTVGLSLNDPIIFSNIVETTGTTNIVAGKIYYVSSIVSSIEITISEQVGGSEFDPGDSTFSSDAPMVITSQVECTVLANGSGSMTMNVGLPISPGQIDGQQFSFYQTSPQILNVSGINGNPLIRKIQATLSVSGKVAVTADDGGTVNFYIGMPFEVASPGIGGLSPSTTYYVSEYSGRVISPTSVVPPIEVTVTNTSGTALTCSTTDSLYPLMPITFSGSSVGGVEVATQYFVANILSSTTFSISNFEGGPELVFSVDNGTMIGTGAQYIEVVDEFDNPVPLTDEVGYVTMTQTPIGTAPTFDVSYVMGGYYNVFITNAGEGYALTNTILIRGTEIPGGQTPDNDLTLTVSEIGPNGEIVDVIRSGTPPGNMAKYYVKVISGNEIELYQNAALTVPVSGVGIGFTSTFVTSVIDSNSLTDEITVVDGSGFVLNDRIVFTGTVGAGLTLGQTYYVTSITAAPTITYPNQALLQISVEPNGATEPITTNGLNCTAGTIGDFAVLPTPFYFNRSIVKYNNRVYQCLISNNDDNFIFGKWELLDSGSYDLNALDRITGYYQPTVDMPGVDLTQLVNGIVYPNSTYLGNAFDPDAEFPIDTILQDQPFYPSAINIKGVIWDGTRYVATADTSTYTATVSSVLGDEWIISKVSQQPINSNSILYNNGIYFVTTNTNAMPILESDDCITWTGGASSITVQSTSLNKIAYYNNVYVAVGENILATTNINNWSQTFEFTPTPGVTNILNDVKFVDVINYTGFITVGKGQQLNGSVITNTNIVLLSLNGYQWYLGTSPLSEYGLNSIAYNDSIIVAVGDNSGRYISANASNWVNYSSVGTGNPNLNSVVYANSIFVAVGDNGVIETSTDGITWTSRTSGTTQNLNSIIWNDDVNEFLAVGDNNVTLKSTNGVTWVISTVFITDPTFYNVQGDSFTSGYGPEEMVPGLVTDSLTLITTTRPGTNWDAAEYAHVGYNVVSIEVTPTTGTQVTFDWNTNVQTPSQLAVYGILTATGLGVALYKDVDYTIDWIAQTITMNYTLSALGYNKIRIDIYEPGNGYQLVKSNTETDPLRINSITGFSEIYTDARYSSSMFSGSGMTRPGTVPVESTAVETTSYNNTITVDNIQSFIVNSPIKFYGDVFGGIVEDTTYYVKSISVVTNKITVSDIFNIGTGTAGSTFELTDDTGEMNIVIQTGVGEPWAAPTVYHNGDLLVHGYMLHVTRTNGTTNTITCNSTGGLVVGDKIVFSQTMFGTVIVPNVVYYIDTIYDNNEFTISETQFGTTLSLDDATGGASAIVNDYAFAPIQNSINGKIVFLGEEYIEDSVLKVTNYQQGVDYLAYTIFGETIPEQYEYTIPETQMFVGDGSTTVFSLTNYVGFENKTSGVVEVNGLRLTDIVDYTINSNTNEITFVSAPTGTIAVTTYNETLRQYFNTQYGITGKTVANITSINNTISPPLASTTIQSTSGTTITCSIGKTTAGFFPNQPVVFKGTTSFGGIDIDGLVYFVVPGYTSNTFEVSLVPDGPSVSFSAGSGILAVFVGGQPAVRVTTGIANGLTTNDIVRIDGTTGSIQLNNNTYYVHKITDYQFDLYQEPYDPTLSGINYPITETSGYTGGGYAWIDGSYIATTATATATDVVVIGGENIYRVVCDSSAELIDGTPIIFTKEGSPLGTDILGGLISGTKYFVKSRLDNEHITISEKRNGDMMVLTPDTNTVNVTAWEQDNVDRLWVTINGYRVPSSLLRLNTANYISILTTISPSDEVIITSMMPSATPGQEVYMTNVSLTEQGSVYQTNNLNRTWLTQDLYNTDEIIYVYDITRLTDIVTQNVIAPAEIDGITSIGIAADKNTICQISVFNVTTNQTLSSSYYSIQIVDVAPRLFITDGVSMGDSLIMTVLVGDLIYINGEQIGFTTVNPIITANNIVPGQQYTIQTIGTTDYTSFGAAYNTVGLTFTSVAHGSGTGTATALNGISGLQRGTNGTAEQAVIYAYTPVLAMLSNNRMSDVGYAKTWNSYQSNATVATVLEVGEQYVIVSLGTTDFTLIGAKSNTVGIVFTTTAVGTGTGTATLLSKGDPLQISDTSEAVFLNSERS